jgi:N-acetylneuraminate lyase
MRLPLNGLITAAFTPMHVDGSLAPERVGPMVDHLVQQQVASVFVCGTTGEGPSLAIEERQTLAEAFVEAAKGRLPVIVHVGHNSLAEARRLAAHAQQIGADAVSAVAPSYFKPASAEALVRSLAEVTAAAPELPFYYYHIPSMTGVTVDLMELLERARDELPTMAGLKYTAATLDELMTLLDFDPARFDVFFGRDEMLLAGLTVGVRGFIGSTYNFAPQLYRRLLDAFARGDLEEARRCQARAVAMIRVILRYGAMAGQKAVMPLVGLDCGPVRLPLLPLSPAETTALEAELRSIGFFDWACRPSPPAARF